MIKIGIIGAMEDEVAGLKARMEQVSKTVLARMEFNEGLLEGKPVVVVRSGIGKVNAAVCTQILADRFGVGAVINTGVAGSLDARIDIGDFVISTDAVHHDMDATVFGYAPGEVPQLGQVSFEADKALADAAEAACRKVIPDQNVWRGRVVSGDQFIVSREKKDEIVKTFGGLCTEMEGASIAHAAWLNSLPFLIVRAISDKADESAEMDYPTFEKKAAGSSVEMLCEMLKSMPD
ncbi:MAG: 5'-methylthioadenosine/adenosylhomocysteine nucleosidase [Lachnospiraceae bacterium]|nr:5'-methylthioadenosine/adenosylhomocysteine nucleosidase [Lachnospiraceae bacterium]